MNAIIAERNSVLEPVESFVAYDSIRGMLPSRRVFVVVFNQINSAILQIGNV